MMMKHHHIPLRTGVEMYARCYEVSAPRATIVMVHGFPDTGFGWRKVAAAVARGTHCNVVVPDMRGYGYTRMMMMTKRTPTNGNLTNADFSLEMVLKDLVALLDALEVEKAVFLGHDWGGTQVWNMSVHHPERVLAVGSFVTPFFSPNPNKNPYRAMLENPGRFDYQVYFQRDEAARELESNVPRSVKAFVRSWKEPLETAEQIQSMATPTASKGLFAGFRSPTEPMLSRSIMSEAELEAYVHQFETSGYLNALRYYRNVEENWRFNCARVTGKKCLVPALMVTAGKDYILPPSMTEGMETHVPDLMRVHIEDSGHWVMVEQPQLCVDAVVKFLDSRVFPRLDAATTRSSKL